MFFGILLILGIGLFSFFLPPEGRQLTLERNAPIPEIIAILEWVTITLLCGVIAFRLNGVVSRTVSLKQRDQTWIPLVSTGLFAAIVLSARFGAWVPVEISALLALPCVLIPPLFHRVTHSHPRPEPPPLFTLEETCRTLDAAATSPLIREFMERYPHSKVYLYRNPQTHTAGGLFFHNRERLSTPQSTHLEVTLNCPFTTRFGVFAEGRETFRAYLHRPVPEGSIIHFLPQQGWEEWLTGMTKKEWMDRIQDLDHTPPHYQNINGLPCQFFDTPWKWQLISLK